jgi:hypothetical protein
VVRTYGIWGAIVGCILVDVRTDGNGGDGRRWCAGLPRQIRPLRKGQSVRIIVPGPHGILRFFDPACLALGEPDAAGIAGKD